MTDYGRANNSPKEPMEQLRSSFIITLYLLAIPLYALPILLSPPLNKERQTTYPKAKSSLLVKAKSQDQMQERVNALLSVEEGSKRALIGAGIGALIGLSFAASTVGGISAPIILSLTLALIGLTLAIVGTIFIKLLKKSLMIILKYLRRFCSSHKRASLQQPNTPYPLAMPYAPSNPDRQPEALSTGEEIKIVLTTLLMVVVSAFSLLRVKEISIIGAGLFFSMLAFSDSRFPDWLIISKEAFLLTSYASIPLIPSPEVSKAILNAQLS